MTLLRMKCHASGKKDGKNNTRVTPEKKIDNHYFLFKCQCRWLLFLSVSASVTSKKIKLVIFASCPPFFGIPRLCRRCGPSQQSAHMWAMLILNPALILWATADLFPLL